MKTLTSSVHPGSQHDVRNALELLAGAMALACIFWLHPFWTSALFFTVASLLVFSNIKIGRKHP